MSKKDEALKLALDALDCIYSQLHIREINKVGAAMSAIREALAEQPAQQEPLTDAQIGAVAADIWGSVLIAPQSYQKFARAIEAKLKEKNLG